MNTQPPYTQLTTGYILFMDIVGYSLLSGAKQVQVVKTLQNIVERINSVFHTTQKPIFIPAGDGLVISFFDYPENPLKYAIEITKMLRQDDSILDGSSIPLRMGMHAGPVYFVEDIRQQDNLAGAGINIAQRVMDCGDVGHILASKAICEIIADAKCKYRNLIHPIGKYLVKHEIELELYNIWDDEIGNPNHPPQKQIANRASVPLRDADEMIRTPGTDDETIPRIAAVETTFLERGDLATSKQSKILHHAPLTGRIEELNELKKLLQSAIAGKGRLVLLAGEAGIGKTRLSEELMTYAESDGVICLSGACLYQENTAPYLPFIDALREYFLRAKNDFGFSPEHENIEEIILQKTPELASMIGTGNMSDLPQTSSTANLDYELAKMRMFKNIYDVFCGISESTPLFLFIDDVQWADFATLHLLHYIAQRIGESRILLLASYRPEDLHGEGSDTHQLVDVIQRMSRENLFEEIKLKRLSIGDVQSLAKSVFTPSDFRSEFLRSLFDETEGNPLFVLETLKLIWERGMIVQQDDGWTIGQLKAIPMSKRLHDVVMRRIDCLDEEERELLECAAVVGGKFNSSVLAHLTELRRIKLLRILGKLERKYGIIRSSEGEYCFDHEKILQVLYEGIPDELKREYHLLIGEYLEENCEDENWYPIAYHYRLSGEYQKAYKYFVKSADKASNLHAHDKAINCLENAIELLKLAKGIIDSEEQEAKLLLNLGDEYYNFDIDKALEGYLKCLDICKKHRNQLFEAVTLKKIANVRSLTGEWETAFQLYMSSLKLFEQFNRLGEVGNIHNNIGYNFFESGDWNKAEKYYQSALEIGNQIEDLQLVADAESNLGIINTARGQFEEAIEYYQKSLNNYKSIDDNLRFAQTYQNLGMGYAGKREWETAIECYQNSIEISKETGDLRLEAISCLNSAEAFLALEDLVNAKEFCNKAMSTFRILDDHFGMAESNKIYGIISKDEYDWTQAEQCFNKSAQFFLKSNRIQSLAEVYREMGIMYKKRGMNEEEINFLKKADDLLQQLMSDTSLD